MPWGLSLRDYCKIYTDALLELCDSQDLFGAEGSIARIKGWQNMIRSYVPNDKDEDMLIRDVVFTGANKYTLTTPGDNNYFTAKAVAIRAAVAEDVWDKVKEELGDFLFATVNAARLYGLNPDTALERTCAKFRRRFTYLEEHTIRKDRNKKSQVDTISYIPAVFGCTCAQAAIQHLLTTAPSKDFSPEGDIVL